MIPVKNDPIDTRLAETQKELLDLKKFPNSEFIGIIKELGFKCELCARCCTKEFNDHVFLLDSDLERIRSIDPKQSLLLRTMSFATRTAGFTSPAMP